MGFTCECQLAPGTKKRSGYAFVFLTYWSSADHCVQDHAPGSILVEEAGGIITDSRGSSLDFGLGRTLGENHGFVAAGKDVHSRALDAVQKAQADEAAASGNASL